MTKIRKQNHTKCKAAFCQSLRVALLQCAAMCCSVRQVPEEHTCHVKGDVLRAAQRRYLIQPQHKVQRKKKITNGLLSGSFR